MTQKVISQFPRAIALPYAGRMANLFFKSNEIARAVACSTSGFTLGLFHTAETLQPPRGYLIGVACC